MVKKLLSKMEAAETLNVPPSKVIETLKKYSFTFNGEITEYTVVEAMLSINREKFRKGLS